MFRSFVVSLIVLAISSDLAWGHGLPIDVIVKDGKLAPFSIAGQPVFEAGILEQGLRLDKLLADAPGFGVANAANGIAPQTKLGLDVVSGLEFWDGQSIMATSAQLEIESPSADARYLITADSQPQTAMEIGEYTGARSWEQHGFYFVTPTDAPPGIYAVMIQLTSPTYITSDPFLLPLVFDPFEQLEGAKLIRGMEILASHYSDPADVNFDGMLDMLDINSLCSNLATPELHWDVNLDGIVSQEDVVTWLGEKGTLDDDTDLNGAVNFVDFVTFAQHGGWQSPGDEIQLRDFCAGI